MLDINVNTPDNLNQLFEMMQGSASRKFFYLAGGTDLVIRAKDGQIRDAVFVNIQNLNELKGIRVDGGKLIIGALTKHSELVKSEVVQQNAEVLALAAKEVGSPQIRNLGTIGGNVGNASPAGDTIPALYALDAEVILISAEGERAIKIYDFFSGPSKTVMKTGEIIKEIHIPLHNGYMSAFKKLGQRKALAISKINLAVVCKTDDNVIKDIKISAGAVAPTVLRAVQTEEFLLGKTLDTELIGAAEEIIKSEVTPIDDIRSNSGYRRDMAGILLRKVLREFKS